MAALPATTAAHASPVSADSKPGHVDPLTGNWITSTIDLSDDGLLVTRNHTAGQRDDTVRDNEAVLGPDWQLEPLDGMVSSRLKDDTAKGYVEVVLSVDAGRYRFQANPDGTFARLDGVGTLVKNADGTFTQTMEDADVVYIWSKVGQEYLITAVGAKTGGKQLIEYDATGRFKRITVAPTPEADCENAPGSCSSAAFQYATTTTATAGALGDVAGQLKSISYDAAGAPAAVTAVSYKYDAVKRLRQVEDARRVGGDPIRRATYSYDTRGNVTGLATSEDGAWKLTYSAPGKLAKATPAAGGPVALAAKCPVSNVSDYLLKGLCTTRVDVLKGPGLSGRVPSWKRTPTGGSVMGISHDGCSAPGIGDKPQPWVNFKPACDAHDYGYGLIRNKLNGERNGLPRSKRAAVDAVFHTILKERVCAAVKGTDIGPKGVLISRRSKCLSWAGNFYRAVRLMGDGHL